LSHILEKLIVKLFVEHPQFRKRLHTLENV
jgi:hypothetical protein